MNISVDLERKPIEDLLAFEIASGIVNLDKLRNKLSASMEFVNKEMNAFDIRKGLMNRIAYNDALVFKINVNGQIKPLLLVSPRLRHGRFYAKNFLIGEYQGLQPCFNRVKHA